MMSDQQLIEAFENAGFTDVVEHYDSVEGPFLTVAIPNSTVSGGVPITDEARQDPNKAAATAYEYLRQFAYAERMKGHNG